MKNKYFNFHGVTNLGSTLIRGFQIAEYFEGSTVDFTNYDGVNIYIKLYPRGGIIPNYCYCDIVDNVRILRWLNRNPQVGAIVISKMGFNYVKSQINLKNIKLIPQHHCNKQRILRPDRLVETVGFIGSNGSCQLSLLELEIEFKKSGLNFIWLRTPFTLNQVIEFYQKIDIQIVYRIWDKTDRNINLKDGLKIFNAGSFGIPTVATPEPGYDEEYDKLYLKVNSPKELIENCVLLKTNKSMYQDIVGEILSRSKIHHIDNIIPLYRELLNNA